MTYFNEMLSLLGGAAVQGVLKALISLIIGILAIRVVMSVVKKALEKIAWCREYLRADKERIDKMLEQ